MGSKLTNYRPQQHNANKHTPRGLKALEESVQRDGWIGAITVAADGETFDGSARIEVGAATGFDDAIVVESDGSKPVVVKRMDIPTANDERARRLGVAANRVAQLDLDWDAEVLAELVQDMDLSALFTDEEMTALLGDVEVAQGVGGDDFDTTPQDGPTRTQVGDLWAIGGVHRLLVGDCTNLVNVERLMGGERADACVMDSPYGISREGIENDDESGLYALFAGCLKCLPIDNGVVVNFQSPRLFPLWLDAIRHVGHKFERMLWMYKSNDETFPWRGWLLKSEAILVSTVGKGQWQDVHPYAHDCYSPTTPGKELPEGTGWHASVKPLAVVIDIVTRVCPHGGIVYDGFLGSGTTLVAGHRAGRNVYGCELVPRYADVCLSRAEAEGLICERVPS